MAWTSNGDAPGSKPQEGYVVSRQASCIRWPAGPHASALHEAGIKAHGLVVDADPEDAVRDAMAMLDTSRRGDRPSITERSAGCAGR